MAKEIYPKAYLVKPKQEDLIVSVDFGQGEDISNMMVTRLHWNGRTEIVSTKRIGRAKDFTEDKIKEFLSNIENNGVEI